MKKNKILITLASIAILLTIAVATFAAFTFVKQIRDTEAKVGTIDISSKSYLTYANNVSKENKTTQEYLSALKERSNVPLEIPSASRIRAEIDEETGKSFILKNEFDIVIVKATVEIENNNITNVTAKSGDDQITYYVSNSSNVLTIKVQEFLSTIAVAECSISDNKISSISAQGLDKITCYATEKAGFADEDPSQFYINQLGFKFTFESKIPVYFRIHFEDAWISTKTYTSNTSKKNYITKGNSYIQTDDEEALPGKQYYVKSGELYKKIEVASGADISDKGYYEESSDSAFTPKDSTNWIYDAKTNCAYYKSLYNPTTSEVFSAEFEINNSYWYAISETTAYRESIKVEVSFYVDIVQANRAEKLWDVDFDSLGIN